VIQPTGPQVDMQKFATVVAMVAAPRR